MACSVRLYFTNECFAMSENFDEHFYGIIFTVSIVVVSSLYSSVETIL